MNAVPGTVPGRHVGVAGKSIVGYSDPLSVATGEEIRFKVSCQTGETRYSAQVFRLFSGDLHPDGPGFRAEPVATAVDGEHAGRRQEIVAGSCAIVEATGPLARLRDFTLSAFILPTAPTRGRQTVMGRWGGDPERGYALIVDDDGSPALVVSDGTTSCLVTTDEPLGTGQWHFVAAGYDAGNGRVVVFQQTFDRLREGQASVGQGEADCAVAVDDDVPFTIAAAWGARRGRPASWHFNGTIEAPRVLDRALDADEIRARAAAPADPARDAGIVAAWDFAIEMSSTRMVDASPNRLHGRLVNLPARAMRGRLWDGSEMNWRHAPEQYGAIHFHDDDLYDAGWDDDFILEVPDDLPSGVYAVRLRSDADGDWIPFFVRPPRDRATAPAALLLPTASYLAYANERGAFDIPGNEAMSGYLATLSPEDLFLNEHREYGYSLYDTHSDGSGVCHSSRLRPILNMRPGRGLAWGGPGASLPWQFDADLAIVDWLDAMGQPVDILTDEDLHVEGSTLLCRYRAVITGTHPEYATTRMLDALEGYLHGGGRLMYLGGNGFYWRIAFHDELPGVIELRRAEDGIRDWKARPGEYYHGFNGEYGGLWRRNGRPPQVLVGVGMAGQGFDRSSCYVRRPESTDPRAAFIFDGVDDEVIGDFGRFGGGAAGIEMDRADGALGTPPHALVVASSRGHSALTFPGPEDVDTVSGALAAPDNPDVRADLVFFETGDGGAVFSTGSIAWAGALAHDGYDNNVSRITANVLRRFLDPAVFPEPCE